MKKSKIVSLTVALLLIVVGVLISVLAFSMMDFDYRNLSTVEMATNAYTIEGDIGNINIDAVDSNIRFAVSDNDICVVECKSEEGISHYAKLEGDTLVIRQEDERKFDFYIGIKLESNEIVVYLPEKEYNELMVNTESGDVDIPDGFSFAQTEISTESGDVNVEADVADNLSIQTSSGDITLKNVNVEKIIKIKSSSGDVELKNCDAHELDIETSSGDVSGILQTGKMFTASSSSGDIEVPIDDVLGGECRVKTSSGDIRIDIMK